ERVVELVGCDRQHRDDDLHLVADAVDERRAQRAVDETADEDRLRRGTTLATEERAGDLAGGVGTLLDVDRQGEEVEAVTRVLRHARRGEQHRLLVEVGRDGALRLLSQTSGFEPDGAGAVRTVVQNGFGELDLGTFHEVSLLAAAIRAANASEQERAGRTWARTAMRTDRLDLVNSRRAPTRPRTNAGVRRTTTGDQLRAGLLRSSPSALRLGTAVGSRPGFMLPVDPLCGEEGRHRVAAETRVEHLLEVEIVVIDPVVGGEQEPPDLVGMEE